MLGYIYQYVAILRERGIQKYIYDEQQQISQISFQYKENSSRITSYIMKLAKALHYYPNKDIVVADYLYEDFDAALIAELLGCLQPQNMILVLRSQKL